jgi:hypothetical protein
MGKANMKYKIDIAVREQIIGAVIGVVAVCGLSFFLLQLH